jgi:predicted O-linked N-acetylglucosamine transferase (SPINDLY family)
MRAWARSTFDWNTIADSWHEALTGPQANAALASYDHAIRLNPDHAEAHHGRGCALHAQLAYEAAIECYDQAIRLKPDYANAHANRGNALLALKQYSSALAGFDRALALQPDYEYLRGTRLYTKRQLCDWHNADGDLAQLEAAIARSERVALPFATLALTASPALQKRAAEIYVADKHPPRPDAAPILPYAAHSRIRIGYFSADFHNHATSYLMAELFERHDRTRFEILGFSFGPDTGDPVRRRVSAAMDRFLDVRSLTDHDVAQLSRSLEVDIAVDLKGFTRDHRAGIFAHRAAPIQVNYLGYPGTMGAPWIDYLIADSTLIPACDRRHYTEKIVCLPGTYQPNDARRPIAATTPTRAVEGLPETGFVFCCFNNTYKIAPAVFALWMRILARVEGSVLWLLEDNPATIANLRAEAARRGISPERLIFAHPQPLADHLARHALAGLFLDTTPYNAHTAASDALWAGLPILTLPNETFAGRVAASLLRATSLPEPALTGLIAATESEYEQRAVALAQDPERLLSLRTHLLQSRATAPLFDTATFTRHLEAAYTAMHSEACVR